MLRRDKIGNRTVHFYGLLICNGKYVMFLKMTLENVGSGFV